MELEDGVTKPLTIVFEKLAVWKRGNITPIFKTRRKKGDYKLVALTLVPGKIMEQILLWSMPRHTENDDMSQHGFTNYKSWLSNLAFRSTRAILFLFSTFVRPHLMSWSLQHKVVRTCWRRSREVP